MIQRPPPPDLPASAPPRQIAIAAFRRSTLFPVLGVALAVNEFVIEPEPRGLAVLFAGALLSLPPFVALNAVVRNVLEQEDR